jgi:DNA primase
LVLEKIVEACSFLLKEYPEAQSCRDYLNGRLLPESQEKFQFGYFPNIKNISALTNLIDPQSLINNKLLSPRQVEDAMSFRQYFVSHFENHPLIMPFKDTYGKVVSLVGRTLLDEKERKRKEIIKYKNTFDFKKGNYVFGLYENKKNIAELGFVYVVEGQIDVIKAMEIGINNIVGLGSNSITNYQYSVISRYTQNFHLLLDNDEAGKKGRHSFVKKFGKFANIQHFYIPDQYKDIDEYLSTEHIESYEQVSFSVKPTL